MILIERLIWGIDVDDTFSAKPFATHKKETRVVDGARQLYEHLCSCHVFQR